MASSSSSSEQYFFSAKKQIVIPNASPRFIAAHYRGLLWGPKNGKKFFYIRTAEKQKFTLLDGRAIRFDVTKELYDLERDETIYLLSPSSENDLLEVLEWDKRNQDYDIGELK